jgi:hypothetical protein
MVSQDLQGELMDEARITLRDDNGMLILNRNAASTNAYSFGMVVGMQVKDDLSNGRPGRGRETDPGCVQHTFHCFAML